ncbi:hypothetical protein E3P81_03967 [Wallemia ichthyophaga]|nr:Ras-related GTP-binding protein D [Wallemia ichthyophaga EXF-994]TIA87361.1 hypothetical protein E3P97_03974 [Wallemia ichthyophaga]EOR04574.1 Ras-related GTP-binding protein D [Wallemia ichthyophaga EXF-994]TIB27948.1 hypothetical protein E3P85_03951 [Wallemia ichthyophaga]TIB43455.1 hypothetical protein E3P82_03973 [Wallemia ichthyophaga]TIB45673.1 hypothetical protein E3P81_03967 [Wallemia ichthyophaga]
MAAKDTLYLENNIRSAIHNVDSFVGLQLWDIPGHANLDLLGIDLSQLSTLVFVVDAQDDYTRSLTQLHQIILRAYKANKQVNIEIFVHKVDGLSDEYKLDTIRDIKSRVSDGLSDYGLDSLLRPQLSYHLTSIYDHSILDAFSKVVQKLAKQLPVIQNLLNVFCANSGIAKAFLFEQNSRLYFATDATVADASTFEVCVDALDTFDKFSKLYKYHPSIEQDQDQDQSEQNQDQHLNPIKNLKQPATASIRLASDITISKWQIHENLILIALIKSDTFDRFKQSIDYNVSFVRDAIVDIVEMEKRSRSSRSASIATN